MLWSLCRRTCDIGAIAVTAFVGLVALYIEFILGYRVVFFAADGDAGWAAFWSVMAAAPVVATIAVWNALDELDPIRRALIAAVTAALSSYLVLGVTFFALVFLDV